MVVVSVNAFFQEMLVNRLLKDTVQDVPNWLNKCLHILNGVFRIEEMYYVLLDLIDKMDYMLAKPVHVSYLLTHLHSLNLTVFVFFNYYSGCVTLLLTCSLPSVAMITPRPRTSRRSWKVLVLRPMTPAWARYRAVSSFVIMLLWQ